jgi:hypothetical protein
MKKFLLSLIAIVLFSVFLGCNEDSNPTGSNSDINSVNPDHDTTLYGEWYQKYEAIPNIDTISYGLANGHSMSFSSKSFNIDEREYTEWRAEDGIVFYYYPEVDDTISMAYEIHGDTLFTWWNKTTHDFSDRHSIHWRVELF